jgi:hypothetical protein
MFVLSSFSQPTRLVSFPQQLRNNVFGDLEFAAVTEVHYFYCYTSNRML